MATKAEKLEREQAITQLRDWIKPGDTVYTILDHVSRSGMLRAIRVVLLHGEEGRCTDLHPNWAIGKALGLRHWRRNGREQDALVIGGCGMDMGFHLVHELSYVLYGSGYPCLGKEKCPSNYHVNHRDRIRCDGVIDGETHRFCHRPDPFGRWEIADDWPRSEPQTVDTEDGPIRIPGRLLACLSGSGEEGRPYEVCPTCQGLGDLPNPEGPERFDLVHTDGYALRHRWL